MTTDYVATFIQIAADCPAEAAEVPPARGEKKTVALLQYELIAGAPYRYTSDDVLFEVHAIRHEIPDDERDEQRAAFFAKDQACLRSSPLGKRYGWGIHHDQQGRVALVAVESERYRTLADDPSVTQLSAMRSKRA